jgi:arylsulfatase A-like enzyme
MRRIDTSSVKQKCRLFSQLVLLLALSAYVFSNGYENTGCCDDASSKPNILLILADDMGYSDLGCYGGEIETPHLDALATNGLRYTQFYNTGRCWPTRCSLMTGYYPTQIRMDPPRGRFPDWAVPLPRYLGPLGYRCYHSGKWHVRGAPKPIADAGFDRSYMLEDQDRFFHPTRHSLDDKRLPPVEPSSDYYASTVIADHAIECLESHAEKSPDQPFFEYLAFTSPHFPLHAPQEDIDKYRTRYQCGWDEIRRERFERMQTMGLVNYDLSESRFDIVPSWNFSPDRLSAEIGPGEAPFAVPWDSLSDEQRQFQADKMAIHAAMIDRMDQEVGRVLQQVRDMGAWENTVVIFFSDNGASAEIIIRGDMHDPEAEPGSAASYLCLGPGWSTAANTPLTLHKSWNHEGGISTPLIVHWPDGIKDRGALRMTPGHVVDLAPTILDLVGPISNEEPSVVESPLHAGISLTPSFSEDVELDREYLYFRHAGNRALRTGNWKIVSRVGNEGRWELYDLSIDRCEQNDLCDEHPERLSTMVARWEELDSLFQRQAGDP